MNDDFEIYYTEKLWETIPSIYRHEGGLTENPGVLRGIVQVLAKQAAILRRSQDALWDDQFIELCNEWAVPYIGDLVGTRLLSALNNRGRRVDVAKTIYYRRRKGTPRILEELINDISGWEGKMVEQFTELARARHGLDAKPELLAGKYSETLPGGWANIRNQKACELVNGPFDEFFHTIDTRRHHGQNGRYSIQKLAFYLYRLRAFSVIGVTPFDSGDGKLFSFDPSGRAIPLFSKSSKNVDWDKWQPASEAELPAPISCRLLAHTEYLITEAIVVKLIGLSVISANLLRKLIGYKFKNEESLKNVIASFPSPSDTECGVTFWNEIKTLAIVPTCGKQILLPDKSTLLSSPLDKNSILVGTKGTADFIFTTESISAGSLITAPVTSISPLIIDAENGKFLLENTLPNTEKLFISFNYGFSGNIGAGTYNRPWVNDLADSFIQNGGAISALMLPNIGTSKIVDSNTYGPIDSINSVTNLIFQSKNNERPFIRLESDWIIESSALGEAELVLDGIWFGAQANNIFNIIIKGDFERITINNATIDPGGSLNIKGETINPVQLIIEAYVDTLCINASILGPISVQNGGIVEELCISDSIIQAVNATDLAIRNFSGETIINRTTIFGTAKIHRLQASEVLSTNVINVTDTQNGCFRFSSAPILSRLPRPYECYLFQKDSNHWFTSRKFGQSGYAQLSESCPNQIKDGAENGSEMGAFSMLLNPIKFAGLQSKIDEYMPFGLLPIFINQT